MKTGTELILGERQRQISVENYDAAHDDRHDGQELQRAAECYFLSGEMFLKGFKSFRPPDAWPWYDEDWKSSDAIRDFTKAGALWLAEIARMKRMDQKESYSRTILKNLSNRVEQCVRMIDTVRPK